MKKIENPINHPYMQVLQSTLQNQKTLLECYEKRMSLISIGLATKNEFERNEIEITKIKTQGEIDICKRIIKEKEDYFIKFMNQFVIDLDECNKEFEATLKQARMSKDENIVKVLQSANFDAINTNEEVRIHFYKRLKSMLK